MPSISSERRRLAIALGAEYDGVLSRRLLGEVGADRHVIAREVAADRWVLLGRETVALHTGGLSDRAWRWRAIWEVGAPDGALDGTTALQAAGVLGLDDRIVHVSMSRDTRRPRVTGVRPHRLNRAPAEVISAGVPRVRPAIAALRAASWAVSDRQAALFLVMPVQQRVILACHLQTALCAAGLRDRRGLVTQLVADIADGAHSLGELDFARLCRQRGLPPPDRQAVRYATKKRVYLDVCWTDIGLVVEIDGSGHQFGIEVSRDNLRQNRVVLGGDLILRIDLIGLQVFTEELLDQICEAHAYLSLRKVG